VTVKVSVSSAIGFDFSNAGSASRGMMDERRPENDKLGPATIKVELKSSFKAGLPVAAGMLGGSIWPLRTALLVMVLGVANLEILNVLAFGVPANRDALFVDLLGE
jgi:hypothetical protein